MRQLKIGDKVWWQVVNGYRVHGQIVSVGDDWSAVLSQGDVIFIKTAALNFQE